MKETSATIIDFNAYRTNRRAAVELSRDDVRSSAPYSALGPFWLFWPFLAWMPFGLLNLLAAEQEPL
ncbi:hypothetical protein KIP88_44545 [Bradyrhizobium sp. SRL28]|uniref:hypothetical protein n=1 Tax=Bradyrhizobium sp. SRL28 TaxID=2836178 RepID=UPI001BDDE95D|nr:hypothetical protein [Bradyrhizobium sp. SRL28]MBT1517380.1 hypothetical protein [Bradyrhizobium sp. SRL28]